MLIQCPSCKTTYKVSDEVLKGTAPVFRCSRCKHTFELQGQQSGDPPPLKDGEPSAKSQDGGVEGEFAFRFSERDEERLRDDNSTPGDSPKKPLRTATARPDDDWGLNPAETNPETPFTISDLPEWDRQDDFDQEPDDGGINSRIVEPLAPQAENDANVLPLDPYRDQQVSTLPYMTLFAILIICFSLLTALHITYPEASEAIIREIPLVGAAVVRNGHLKDGLLLKSIHGSYQTIQGNRDVFIVTGIASNENPVIVREVQLGGRTYAKDGKSVEKQSMWVGNALSSSIIRGMTLQDISDLQRLKPLKSFEIPPGDSIPFTIVFLRSGKGIQAFSCKVLAAEGNV